MLVETGQPQPSRSQRAPAGTSTTPVVRDAQPVVLTVGERWSLPTWIAPAIAGCVSQKLSSSWARTRLLLEASQPGQLDRHPVVVDLVAGDPGGEVDLLVDVARCRGRGLHPAVPAAAMRTADAVGGAGDDVQGAAALDPVELVLLVLEAEVADGAVKLIPPTLLAASVRKTSAAARDTRTAPVSAPE